MPRVVRIQSRICVGGPALHSILLSEGLRYANGARYDTVLIGGGLEPGELSMAEEAKARRVELEIVPEMRRAIRPVEDARALAVLYRRLRALEPAIVHTHTSKAGALGRTAARAAGVPVVVHTFHGNVFDGYFAPATARALLAVERGLARISDCILAVSERQRDDLVERFRIAPPERVRVIPLGLDLGRFARAKRSPDRAVLGELGVPRGAPVVVAAGRLVAIKRFDVLIDAFARVQVTLPEAWLFIAGDGAAEDRMHLERRAKDAGARVLFLGWRRDLERIYAEADVFALASDNEGTPVAMIEALSAGLPVVATAVGGVKDVVASGMGILVAPGDPGTFAEALLHTLRAGAGELPETLRRRVTDRYSHERLIADMSGLYDDLLERKHAAGAARAREEVVSC